MANPVSNAQNFCNAHAAAQLAILPQFSFKLSEDKFTKLINHKGGVFNAHSHSKNH
jgi:hypothetical protein